MGEETDGKLDTKARYNVADKTICTDPNDPLAYVPGLEHPHPNMSKIGGHGGKLEREREREISLSILTFIVVI